MVIASGENAQYTLTLSDRAVLSQVTYQNTPGTVIAGGSYLILCHI